MDRLEGRVPGREVREARIAGMHRFDAFGYTRLAAELVGVAHFVATNQGDDDAAGAGSGRAA
jgi:hypothetical protein